MTTRRSFFTKALAVFLSAVMLLGVLSAGVALPAAIVNAAAEERSPELPVGDLTFVVPEAIYLYPNGSSWTTATSTPFQYYVNNDADNQPITAASDTGKIYYEYDYMFDQVHYGAQTAAITWQFVDGSFRALSGGSVTLSSSTITSGGSVDITGGKGPSLGASAKGCYILWTLTLTDTADCKVKNVYALTYVYKPYVAPVGAMVRTKNLWGLTTYISFAQQLTWISGMHSITQQTTATHDGNYYPNYSGAYGMSAFITAGDTAYVGTTAYTAATGLAQNNTWTASASGATLYNLAFINTAESTAHFNDTEGHNDSPATNWGSTSSSASTFDVSSFDYYYKENGSTDHNVLAAVYATPYGNITIDTSRYSNLNQIPNLAVGLMATDNQEAENGNWYVGDYSEGSRSLSYNGTKSDTTSNSRSEYFNDRVYIIAGQGTNSWDNFGDYEAEGVKYAGAWPRTLLNVPAADDAGNSAKYESTYNYAIKGMYANEDPGNSSDYCFTHAMVRLAAKQYDKSTLRAAVQRAISKMPSLGVTGISSGNITSCYFDANSSYKWSALQAAFKNAVIGLTTLDSIANPNDLAKALDNALDALCTKVTVDPNGGSFETLTGTEYVNIGVNQYHRYTPTFTNPLKEYYTFEGWSGEASSLSGLTYVNVGYNNTVYATWKPVPYTITLDNGLTGDQNVVKTLTYNIETDSSIEEMLAAAEITDFPGSREGWDFWYWAVVSADEGANWTVTNDQGEPKIFSSTPVENKHGNVTLRAVWSAGLVGYTVYNYEMYPNGSYLNDHNRLVPADSYTDRALTNEIVTIDPADIQQRTGFTVNTQKSRLTGTVAANGSLILKVFYDRVKYNVTFEDYDHTELQTKECYYGAAPVYTGATPRRAAENGITYTYAGWTDGVRTYTEKDSKGNYILPEITADTVLTAYYTETETLCNVTSAAGEGTVINVEEGAYHYGTTISVSASAIDGYVADGLKLYANGEEIENPSSYELTGDVEFTTDPLDLVPSHIVTFYDAEGNKLSTVTVNDGGNAETSTGYVAAPEREGYTFAQWSLPVTNVTEDLTVIAQYTKDGATNYSFNFYQEAVLLATLVREAGEEFVFPSDILGEPAKAGFTFQGWDKTFSPAAENLDVYAVFQADGHVDSFTLTIVYGNGTANEDITRESGTTITVEYPEFAGHVFTGWTGDTSHLNGTVYSFADADETITATWYDLTDLNAAEEAINGILAERDLYRSDYVIRLTGLVNEKAEKTAAVPASATALDDLLARMNAAVTDAPNYLLYTLFVYVDGSVVETIKDIDGETVTIRTQPTKSGYSFNGWTVDVGAIDGSSYTFIASNAEATATWVISAESVAALRAEIEAIDDDIYCIPFINELLADLAEIEALDLTDPANNETAAFKIEALREKMGQKDQHRHQYTVYVDHDADNPPTCTAAGYDIYACINCSSKTTRKPAAATNHSWGEWVTVTEATYYTDGEAKRTCANCGEEQTKVISISDKVVKFVVINGMSYKVMVDGSDPITIKTYTLQKWSSQQSLRFKVNVSAEFPYPEYIVYINGEQAYPDPEGYYTVAASPNLDTVSIAGAIPESDDDDSGKVSVWQWLINLFRSIADFFRNLFK